MYDDCCSLKAKYFEIGLQKGHSTLNHFISDFKKKYDPKPKQYMMYL